MQATQPRTHYLATAEAPMALPKSPTGGSCATSRRRPCAIMFREPAVRAIYRIHRSVHPEGTLTADLDAIDWKILKELQEDGRITNVELARRVGISAPPCLRRMRALEEAGYVKGYR